MTFYRLLYGGTQLGDELIQGLGAWQKGPAGRTEPAGLEPIAKLDDRPAGLIVTPRFRVRRQAADQWDFERWVFDLLSWADGARRDLIVARPDYYPIIHFGLCKFIALDRPAGAGIHAARWSDQVVLTFQADTQPYFYDYD